MTTPAKSSIISRFGLAAAAIALPVICSLFGGYHASPTQTVAATTINIDGLHVPLSTIDLGALWSSGQSVDRQFSIENETGHDIKIQSVQSDCGCTVATWSKSAISPGQSAIIPVQFQPPALALDRPAEFQRRLSVMVNAATGHQVIPLILKGTLLPNDSLQAFPVNLDLGNASTRPTGFVHIKGAASLVNSIPNSLTIAPGKTQRIVVGDPKSHHGDAIIQKDVELSIGGIKGTSPDRNWESVVQFSPSSDSAGLEMHVRGESGSLIMSEPRSIILTDDPAGHEARVSFSSTLDDSIIPDSVTTELPLTWSFVNDPGRGNAVSMTVHLRDGLQKDSMGSIQIRFRSATGQTSNISLPVIAFAHNVHS